MVGRKFVPGWLGVRGLALLGGLNPFGSPPPRHGEVVAFYVDACAGRARGGEVLHHEGDGRPEPRYVSGVSSGCQSSTLFPSQSLIQAKRP
jgi:hypothetical protein